MNPEPERINDKKDKMDSSTDKSPAGNICLRDDTLFRTAGFEDLSGRQDISQRDQVFEATGVL